MKDPSQFVLVNPTSAIQLSGASTAHLYPQIDPVWRVTPCGREGGSEARQREKERIRREKCGKIKGVRGRCMWSIYSTSKVCAFFVITGGPVVIDGIDPWPDWSISSPFFPSYLAHFMQTVNHQGRSMQIYSSELCWRTCYSASPRGFTRQLIKCTAAAGGCALWHVPRRGPNSLLMF